MIVDPDFFEHWRTRMLVDALGGDQMAPMYVMRIWAHCQSRRATSFNMPAAGLRSLCRFPGDAALLESSLIDAGFIERNGAAIDAPTWAEKNKSLVTSWSRGGWQLDVSASEWLRLRVSVFERDCYICVYCGDNEKELDCDHVMPRSRGGLSVMANLVAACFTCNRSKGSKTLEEWGGYGG
jgi:5-methylcytosine-specific restriction endonuclease McrA